ncbi:45226_t:CDS:2, partial [Gigaspora margarita]
ILNDGQYLVLCAWKKQTELLSQALYVEIDMAFKRVYDFDEYYLKKTKDERLDDYLQDLGSYYNDGWYTPIWEVEDPIADFV